jgi:homoserine dehydrogenase
MKPLKIGLFGFGCVGGGLYEVLHQTPGFRTEIVKICVKDRKKKRPEGNRYLHLRQGRYIGKSGN